MKKNEKIQKATIKVDDKIASPILNQNRVYIYFTIKPIEKL